jgi:uncharacterized membrane protein required for colicin V production
MQAASVIDIAFAAVLLIFFIFGLRRGLFRSVIGLVIIIAALVGAGFCAKTFSQNAADFIRPAVISAVEKRVDSAASSAGIDAQSADAVTQDQAGSMMSFLGVYKQSADKLAQSAENTARETGKTVLDGVASSLVDSMAYALVYIISFIALMLILSLIAKVIGLLTAVPGIHFLNALGGGLFGIVQGGLILMFVTWLIRSGVVKVAADTAAGSRMLQFFMTFNPISMISGI